MLEIAVIPVLKNNYLFLIHADGETAAVDPATDSSVLEAVHARGWKLTHIINTHHHWDHTDGNKSLKAKTGCTVIGPKGEQDSIPGIDRAVSDGDTVSIGGLKATVIDIPGHTRGHIAYHFAGDRALFCGDTLFAMGCGRLFEGTPEQMWSSLQKLAALPGETRVYCAHEYTEDNGDFALSIEPGNLALQKRVDNVYTLRTRGKPTIPTTIELEKETNPFLRVDSPEIRSHIGLPHAEASTVFADIRRRKDNF